MSSLTHLAARLVIVADRKDTVSKKKKKKALGEEGKERKRKGKKEKKEKENMAQSLS